jgi:hypothetical protein
MPTISRFYGITVSMHYEDDAPPHVHAAYGGREAAVAIDDGRVLGGSLSPRAVAFVAEWAKMYSMPLETAWVKAARHEALEPITPLD